VPAPSAGPPTAAPRAAAPRRAPASSRAPDGAPRPVLVDTAGHPPAEQRSKKRRAGAAAATGVNGRDRLPLVLRVLAWFIAVPLGLALVGIPARESGYLTGQKLLDVVIGRDLDRFFPLVVIVVLWALVTAILVQVLVEGGAWLMRRRRARRAGPVDAY
jgi:hypothetical protein